jgi:type IV secretion system protein TrbL
VRGGAAVAGGASAAYSLGSLGQSGAAGVASGLGGVAARRRPPPLAAEARRPRRRKRQIQLLRWARKAGLRRDRRLSTMGTVGGDGSRTAPRRIARRLPPTARPAWAKRMKR